MKFLHPAMWHVALESWKWIHQLAVPCNVTRSSGVTCHWIRPNVRHIGILHSTSTTSPQSTCYSASVSEFFSNRTTVGRKKWRHVDFQDGGSQQSWILGSDNGFSEKPNYITSYISSIDTIALNCLVFDKIAFFCILATDRQTNRQTNRWTAPMH